MQEHDVLQNIIFRVLGTHTELDTNKKQLIAAEILAKLIHKTTFHEDNNEAKPSQNNDTDKGPTTI